MVFAGLSIPLLRRGRGNGGRLIALSVYAFSCVFLLAISGVYHLLTKEGTPSLVLRRLDHAGIFLLIAGSFIAVHGILFQGFWRWGMISLISLTALCGIVFKTIFFNNLSEGITLSFYIGLGWFGALSGFLLWRRFGLRFIYPLLAGALAYTVGALLEFFRFPILIPGVLGPHEVFHFFVILGISFHWRFIYHFAHGLPQNEFPVRSPV